MPAQGTQRVSVIADNGEHTWSPLLPQLPPRQNDLLLQGVPALRAPGTIPERGVQRLVRDSDADVGVEAGEQGALLRSGGHAVSIDGYGISTLSGHGQRRPWLGQKPLL